MKCDCSILSFDCCVAQLSILVALNAINADEREVSPGACLQASRITGKAFISNGSLLAIQS